MKLVPISEVCRIVNGGTPKSGVAEYWGGDVEWLTPAEMGKLDAPEIAATTRTITMAGLSNSSAKRVPAGSVILSTRAPIGHLAIPLTTMAFNQGCRGLVPNEQLDTKYLYYFLWFSREALNELGTGTTFKELSSGALGNYKIPLPPLDEQRRIVTRLEKAFAAIATATANAEKNLANARELFEVVLGQSMDGAAKGWECKTLGSLGKTVTGNTPRTSNAGNFGGFIPFIKPGDFNADGTLDYENEGLSETGVLASRRIVSGSALMVCIGATIGKSGFTERDITANQQVNALLPANDVSGKFAYYQFLTAGFQQAVRRQSGQATLPIISKSKWNELPVWLPSHEEQLRIVGMLDRVLEQCLHLEDLASKKLAALTALKQSILHRAFSGDPLGAELLAA